MNRRGAGVAFIAIAAFLTSVRYVLNFIYVAGLWKQFTGSFLDSFNRGLGISATAALIVGIVYIIVAETKKDK